MRGQTDVLVIGGGIAGIVSSIEAARAGAHVTIACSGPLFGGSSFYPGTWGLGLVGPLDEEDETDLIESIEHVGCGVADPILVKTLVRNIRPAIQWLENELGVPLKRPASAESALEAAFIPCFDHANRLWRGITREAFERVAGAEVERLGIEVLEHCELMRLVRSDNGEGAIAGAILFNAKDKGFIIQPARAVVLSTGGTGGLFERSLTSPDVPSSGHGIALDAGCSLVNIEFMQMMPGLVSPSRGVVFNEKTFRYAALEDSSGILPTPSNELSELLETRSGHGPFTSRLGDESVDMAIDAAGENGMAVRYNFPKEGAPEFVRTFARWMENELGITPEDELRIAIYAHAANGGIKIDEHARTGVPRLFACGEATGGMHGADRIGGLSSANGLVFGRIAGKEAAAVADEAPETPAGRVEVLDMALKSLRMSETPLDDMDATRITKDMRATMSAHAMIHRTEEGLARALRDIERLQRESQFHGDCRGCIIPTDAALARGIRVKSQLKLAHVMLTAMQRRRESLGSHNRADS